MKDMSEEKEMKELEMYCAEIHDLGMRDEAKTISEPNPYYTAHSNIWGCTPDCKEDHKIFIGDHP